jgi:hypothetical protein
MILVIIAQFNAYILINYRIGWPSDPPLRDFAT